MLLECALNISEGRDAVVVGQLAAAGSPFVLDVHSDPHHHRSVLTLAGRAGPLEEAVDAVATAAVAAIDLRTHEGVHPRLGVVDVVPFIALRWSSADGVAGGSLVDDDILRGAAPRERFAAWLAGTLDVPCFWYGPGPDGARTLPEVRRRAFRDLLPDFGPPRPHPSAGATAVGARPTLVAYNLFVTGGDVALARRVAADIRGPGVRALGLDLDGVAQVSCNLTDPFRVGPAAVYDAVATRLEGVGAGVSRAELVGLVPSALLRAVPTHRWPELDLAEDRTVEARLEAGGLTIRG